MRLFPLSIFIFLTFWSCRTSQLSQNNAANPFEKEILAYEQKDKTEKYDPASILFIGSSSFKLWKNIETDLAPLAIINRGFGGAKFTDLLYYTPRLAYPHSYRAVATFIANDITGSSNDKKPEEVLIMFKQFVRLIRKHNKKAPIFYVAVTPTPLRWKVWPEIKKGNELIKEYCSGHTDLIFIETESPYLGENGEPKAEYFLADRLHQNTEGYAVWSKIIKTKIQENLYQP
jgi:lysophospholipase L1-like esterase